MTVQEEQFKVKALELAVGYVAAKWDLTTPETIINYAEEFERFLLGIKAEK